MLKNTKQIGLHCDRKLADFIKKQRTAVGGFEQPLALRIGTRKRSLFMNEEFALQESFGECGAVDRNEKLP